MELQYNFDEVVDRQNTDCFKYDYRKEVFGDASVLPMWVADMDFRAPDFVVNAMKERLSHEIYGYPIRANGIYESIINWMENRHQWKVKKEWIGFTPGVVPAFNMALLAFSEPGDKIIIQSPVYHPFYYAINDHKRQLVTNPLQLKNGRYYMDFDLLENQIDEKTRILILCSPHNPTGNVWKKDELEKLAKICIKKNVLIISDEIHADIIYRGNKHVPLASISPEISDHVITLMAASKTFNFAGLSTSYYITTNKTLFNKLHKTVANLHIDMGNIFGNVATESAYRYGEKWLDQLVHYLSGNIDLVENFINKELSNVELIKPEATFLLWIDFRATGFTSAELKKKLIEKGKLGLSEGTIFGIEGEGFQRLNIGCPRSMVQLAMEKIKHAL
jgi:cysteine-S-conjugate beta-lyase